jgi:gamma-butyrobetaine dioxygenase
LDIEPGAAPRATVDTMADALALDDGQVLPLWWLRDMCPCALCVHPNGQRLLDPAHIPIDLAVREWRVDARTLHVEWAPDGHRSSYALAQLRHDTPRRAYDLWDCSAAPHLPTATHTAVTATGTVGRAAMRDWLSGVDRMGCGLLRGVPVVDGEVARTAELFSNVRVTNYGRLFDVQAVVDPTNLAYTSLGLPPHTDNPYRDPVPTLQLLHCLQSSARGGDNVLVDGWHVAAQVRAADPEGFAMLASTAVTFRYRDDEAHLTATQPILELDDDRTDWAVRGVRFNARSMEPPHLPVDRSTAWYRGYTLFARLLADPANQIRLHLEPGDLFIVDNRRVLHGRTAYESNTDGTSGARHLQGCYADIDGLRSTLAVLEHEASE